MAIEQADIDAIVAALMEANPAVYQIQGSASGVLEIEEGDTLTLTFTESSSEASVANKLAKVDEIKTTLVTMQAALALTQASAATAAAQSTTAAAEVLSRLTDERLAKLDRIGTGNAIIQTPVSTTGQITTLVIGDDYLVSLGTQITFRVQTTSTPIACTLAFVSACGTSTLSVEGDVESVESGVFDLVFEVTKAQNAGLTAGVYNYSVEMRDAGGNKITVARSDLSRSRRMNWVARYT